MRGRGTLRARVTLVAAVAVAVVLALSSVLIVSLHRSALRERLDEQLGEQAAELVSLVRGGVLPPVVYAGVDDDAVAQVVGPDGDVLAASTSLVGEAALDVDARAGGGDAVRGARFPEVDDAGYRLFTRRVVTPDGTVLVHVGAPADDVEESTSVLAATLAGVVPVAALVLAALVWAVVGRALAPVEAIRAEVASMDGTDLGRRVPEPPADDEVGRLAKTMNAMLGRIEDATGRQRRFVADASHELRSPLTQIRSELEVDLAHPAQADPGGTARRVLASTVSMQRLVDDLLHLARTDAGAPLPRREPLDLDVVALDVVRQRRGGPVGIDTSGVGAGQVRGDEEQLARALGNLVDNAVRHAATTVTVALAERGGRVELVVDDDGPGIPVGERERIFERFVRLDDSRARGTGGSGLGLAIARDIAAAHRGTLTATDRPGGGARLVLHLPST